MSGASTFLLFLRVGVSLSIVLGLIWLAARVAKRRGKIAARQTDTALDIVARKQLGRRGSLVVVEAGDRRLLVGVTENHIELVADLSAPDRPQPVAEARTVVARALDPVELRSVPDADEPAELRRESLVDALRDLTVRR